MLFNSYGFLLLFLPITVVVYWIIRHSVARRLVILIAGLVFYAQAGLDYLALLLMVTVVTFLAARTLIGSDDPTRRKIGLAIGLSNLGVLAFYKYFNFLGESLNGLNSLVGLPELAPELNVALPLGISFYTFNLLSYCLDVYRYRIPATTSLLEFTAYTMFFPTVSSGPLVRYTNFEQQFDSAPESKRPTITDLEAGLFSLSVGLAKKLIIADHLASAIDPLFLQQGQLGLLGAWIVVIGYTYQLYFDFSGYADIAIGVGRLVGFRLPPNFDAPYAARNITEFWQRWHITLSTWFRDYLFFPLSRTLLKRRKPPHPDRIRTISLIATMTLVGLWHGAAWTFVLWGGYHGILLAIHAQTRAWRWPSLPTGVARGLTFLAVVMGWVIFRSSSLEMAGNLYRSMLGLNGFNTHLLLEAEVGKRFLLYLGGLFIITNLSRDTGSIQPRRGWVYAASVALLLTFSLLTLEEPRTFIYVQF